MPSRDGDRLKQSHAACKPLTDTGISSAELFEQLAGKSLEAKEAECANRCRRCWHDKAERCICAHLPANDLVLRLNVKVLVLMHYKEYLNAGDDAKLLLAALPAERSDLFVFGRGGDWQRLAAELGIDPPHTLLLWPGDGAVTVDDFVAGLPATSPWRSRGGAPDAPPTALAGRDEHSDERRPLLRVVVLDGTYANARSMFRHVRKELPAAHVPLHVALHPSTLSVYHRAQQSYARDSAVGVARSDDPAALRICTVEAFALLLEELGETPSTTRTLVLAVMVNNEALNPQRSATSERTRRRPWREKQRQWREQRQQQQQAMAPEAHGAAATANDGDNGDCTASPACTDAGTCTGTDAGGTVLPVAPGVQLAIRPEQDWTPLALKLM